MRAVAAMILTCGLLSCGYTQPPPPPGGGGGPPGGGQRGGGKAADPAAAADRFLAQFDAKDGKLKREQMTDDRLKSLFDRADADKDGTVTKAELVTLFTREGQQPGGGGPGGPGGPGGRGGPGGGMGGPPIGQVMPPQIQEQLKLSDEQKKQIAELQKTVDDKLAAILTPDQKKQLEQMKTRGPGGRGGPGGPGGGRPGGPPGGGPGGPPPGEPPPGF